MIFLDKMMQRSMVFVIKWWKSMIWMLKLWKINDLDDKMMKNQQTQWRARLKWKRWKIHEKINKINKNPNPCITLGLLLRPRYFHGLGLLLRTHGRCPESDVFNPCYSIPGCCGWFFVGRLQSMWTDTILQHPSEPRNCSLRIVHFGSPHSPHHLPSRLATTRRPQGGAPARGLSENGPKGPKGR